jgi:hypothetical protein
MCRLLLALCAALLCTLPSSAKSPKQTLTILLKYEHPGSVASQKWMRNEVRNFFERETNVDFRTELSSPTVVIGRLVVLEMRGYCSPDRPALRQPGGLALGSTSISNGTVLPFGTIECDRIRSSVARVSDLSSYEAQQQFGQAMGRVVVHELYHMLSASTVHTKEGLTKPGLSAAELVSDRASLPRSSEAAMELAPTFETLGKTADSGSFDSEKR